MTPSAAAAQIVPAGASSALCDRVERAVARSGAGRAGTLDADADLAALGIDSLDLAEIAAELELEFNVVIDDAVFRTFASVRAIADHLAAVGADDVR